MLDKLNGLNSSLDSTSSSDTNPDERTLADALSWLTTEIQKKDEYRQQILLKPESVEQSVQVNALEPTLQIVDQVLKANWESTAEEYCDKA